MRQITGTLERPASWLRGDRFGLFFAALVVGVGAGFGAVGFRYLIYWFTWLATGHDQFGQHGHVAQRASARGWDSGSSCSIPVIGGLLYGPLIYRFAREARGHGVPEVMIAVAENGGRIRPQVSVVKALASALCIGVGGSVGREGPIVQIGSALASSARPAGRGCRRAGCGSWSPAARPAGSRPPSTRRSPGCSSAWRSSCGSSPSTRCSP